MNFNNLDLLSNYQDGGNTKIEEQISGRYVKGVAKPEQHDVNAEVEKNEFIQYPDREISQVDPKGKSHAQGGEMMNLPPETKILSDNIKIGKDLSQRLSDMFDIKLRADSTIAKAMEKIRASIGMEGILIRMEQYLAKIKENNKVKDKDTKRVNEEFLANKIYELEQERTQKKEMENQIFDLLFQVQEARKQAEQMGDPAHQNIRKRPPLEQPTQQEMVDYEQEKAMKKPKSQASPGQNESQSMAVMLDGGRFVNVHIDGDGVFVDNYNDMQAIEVQALRDGYDNLDEFILGSYADGGGIPDRYKKRGFRKVGVKKRAPSGAKHKWEVLARKKVGGKTRYKIVKGGFRGMKDFKSHKDPKRKKRFWDRMGGKNSPKARDPFSPLYWHKRFGTWEEGGVLGYQQAGQTASAYAKNRGMDWPEGVKDPVYNAETKMWDFDDGTPSISRQEGLSLGRDVLAGGEIPDAYKVAENIRNQGGVASTPITPSAEQTQDEVSSDGLITKVTQYDPTPAEYTEDGTPLYEVTYDGDTYLLPLGQEVRAQREDGTILSFNMGDIVENSYQVDTRQEAGYKTGFSSAEDIQGEYLGGEQAGIQAQRDAIKSELDEFVQNVKDGRVSVNPETGKFNLPLTIRGGSSSRPMALGQTKRELQSSFGDLIQYNPELEGKVGFVQPDGSIDPNTPTGQVALPAGFHNVFGDEFDPGTIETVDLDALNKGGEEGKQALSNIGNDALAYNRNRTEYEDVLVPYLEEQGLSIDQFDITNEMLAYQTAEETAGNMGLDYSKIAAGDFSEVSERLGREITSAEQANEALLDAAQFSGIGGESAGALTSVIGEVRPEEEIIIERDTPQAGGARFLRTPQRLAPTPLIQPAMTLTELERVQPIKVSPEAAYQANVKQTKAGMDIITQGVGAQVGANVTNLLGQSGEIANKSIFVPTNQQNAQYKQAAQQANTQIDRQEAQLRKQDMAAYDDLRLKGFTVAEQQRRQFLDILDEDRMARDKEIRELNTLDAIYPQYTYDMFGNLIYDPSREGKFFMPQTALGQNIYASATGSNPSTSAVDETINIDGVTYGPLTQNS